MADIADGPDINLGARQEGDGTRKVDGKSAFDPAKDGALNPFAVQMCFFQQDPRFFATGFFPAENGFSVAVFVSFQKDFYFISGRKLGFLSGRCKFLKRNPACRFKADIDNCHVVFHGDDSALKDIAFGGATIDEGFFQ